MPRKSTAYPAARVRAVTALVAMMALWAPCPATTQDRLLVAAADGQRVDVDAAERRVLELVNDRRREHNLDAVRSNGKLAAAARQFAQWTADHDRMGHEADGTTPPQRAERQGYAQCIITENLAYQYASSGFTTEALAKRLVDGWMNSPPHRRNLLDADVTETGIGVAQSKSTSRWYGVQIFGLPASEKISFELTNSDSGTARYRLGDRTFVLEPRVTRVHERCRPSEIVLENAADPASAKMQAKGGDRFAVTRDGEGKWRLRRE